ncbi:TraB/GumN family protein [Enterovibrio norvegicus]|uniref:TraB/GumN family protein n=1 Tax=Enterovibrio norvegicus TaxID=188144 RepID=UPI0024B0455E|nr:TraB/GumN family protein [Enterovibrio norvegicus]
MFKIITLVFFLFNCTYAFSGPTVWQAKKGELTFLMMGSIHMGKPSFYPLPDSIISPFQYSNGLVVEADLTQHTGIDIPQGATTKSLLNKRELQRLSDIAKDVGVPVIALQNMQPWQSAMALQQAQTIKFGLDATLGIDIHFLSLAQNDSIPIIALESVQQQLDMIASFGENGLSLLTDTINHWEQSTELLPCMIAAWEHGDSHTMTMIYDEMVKDAGPLEHTLIIDRNEKWVDLLSNENRFKEGTYTVVVGALHYYGEEGVLALLEGKGFSISTLTESNDANCHIPTPP